MSRTVEVRVAGQSFRVVSSAPESEVRRLAEVVNAKLAEIVPKGRVAPPNALLLAAIALAHEVEEERAKRTSVEARARDLLRRVVARVDEVLEGDAAAKGDDDHPGAEGEVGEEVHAGAAEEGGHAAEDDRDVCAADEGGHRAPQEARRAKPAKDGRVESDAAVAHGEDATGARGDRGSFT